MDENGSNPRPEKPQRLNESSELASPSLPRGLSVQYTQDVRGCPPAHTGPLWLSVCVRVYLSAHTQDVCGCPSVHISARWSLDSACWRRGLSVQYTQDVCGCRSAHTGRLCVSVSTHRTSVAVRVCSCVSGSAQRTSMAVHQYTYQHVGPWTQHADPSRGLFSTHRTSVAIYGCPSAHTGRPWLSMCVRQHTQDVRGCTSAHTGHLCVSVRTHRTSVAVRVCPSAHTGSLGLSISTHISTLVLGLSTLALPVDCLGDFRPRGLSVQYTQDVRGCPPAHTGRLWLSVAVRQYTQDVRCCPCVSVCVRQHTHRTFVAVRKYTYQHAGPWTSLPVDCSGDFGPRGLSVQYTQDVRGCPSAHTGRLYVSVSTHRTSVAVRVCPAAHTGRLWLSISTHISTLVHGVSMLTLPVDLHTGRPWMSASTHRTSVAVCVCPSAHTRRPWLSISTHISTLALPVDCSSNFGPRGLSVQYTQDVRGCPAAHTRRLWLSLCVRQHTRDIHSCDTLDRR
ncbi:hypothetical protein IGI04_036386 [Brassica rapa subsp. trilocularis]|uniref:Uncharacterized protein n=1 Tax=Brassica rapa subsp. trilocularis TaxID=1813537 RepID=A0ABQ7LEA9_BRACM|nr:hypothetical protein IGI04_036386 [Brassica rapa subsp. trilocularis]